ncbi:hypothetical protein AB4K20DRAFT_1800027 [Rhizopus microsporus]|uniref:Uncharacterized protein n=1 Tax=Rhizopus microsporus TaxID=58291 RepID=A0A1X0RTD4_RHIZD|nr:hypothetical protein BCV71DRAFT_237711 [Rhizopus microsporus]
MKILAEEQLSVEGVPLLSITMIPYIDQMQSWSKCTSKLMHESICLLEATDNIKCVPYVALHLRILLMNREENFDLEQGTIHSIKHGIKHGGQCCQALRAKAVQLDDKMKAMMTCCVTLTSVAKFSQPEGRNICYNAATSHTLFHRNRANNRSFVHSDFADLLGSASITTLSLCYEPPSWSTLIIKWNEIRLIDQGPGDILVLRDFNWFK